MSFFQHPGRLLWLIITSLLLLGLSQVLWINKVWREQEDILQQESNYIFQQTLMTMQDSLVQRNMSRNGIPVLAEKRIEGLFYKRKMRQGPYREGLSETRIEMKSEFRKAEFENRDSDEIKMITLPTDSTPVVFPDGVGRVMLNLRIDSLSGDPINFVFNIQSDSISPEELSTRYAAALDSAELPATFQVRKGEKPDSFGPPKKMTTEPAPGGLLRPHFFIAELYDYQAYLVKKVTPYTLFSIFLFGLTSFAFMLIFNNLKQQQKLAQQKNEFISNVTHELKTPLTTVGVALEALNDFEVLQNPEKTREYLHISKLELERLNLLVDKVLRLSMFEQQALQLHPETLDLVATTRQVIEAMTLQAKNVGALIRFSAEEASYQVFCDRLHLSGVVYNLLDNALKYRRTNPEINVSIGKTTRDSQEFAVLKVQDNSMGIAPEFQQQVFDKFFRVPAGDTHNVKGHGLGLSYVAHVAREHGGNIRVESRPGEGSTFTMEIPVGVLPPGA